MTIKIYVTKKFYNYKTFLITFFTKLDIKYKLVDNYDNNLDIVIVWFNNIFNKFPEYFNKYKKNYTIINRIQNSYLLTNKSLLNHFDFSPFSFNINFNYLNYDKKLMKKYLDEYKYNKYLGNKYWILKYDNSSSGTGSLIVNTDDLYNLDTNKRFLNEISSFKNKKMTYVIQKYLEKPALIDNRKYDIRAYIVIIPKNYNNNIIYKFYLYNILSARITKYKFDLDNINDKKIHLTNSSFQGNTNFLDLNHFVEKNIYNKIFNSIYKQLKEMISSKLFIDIIRNMNKYPYFYNVFGIDFLLDEDYNTYIVDFNSIPGISIARYQYQGLRYSFNEIHMLECIYFKLIRIYNRYKKFITKKNIDKFNKYKQNYSFKNNFKYIYKIK